MTGNEDYTPRESGFLGGQSPCDDVVGTSQRSCAYSKAMIAQGAATFRVNMQKPQQVRSFAVASPHSAPARLARRCEMQSGESHITFTASVKLTTPTLGVGATFLPFEAPFLKNRDLVTWEGRMYEKKEKAEPTRSTSHTHLDPRTVPHAKTTPRQGPLLSSSCASTGRGFVTRRFSWSFNCH